MPKIAVQLVDDHDLLRAGLTLLIDHQQDMEVVGEAADAAGGARMARARQPAVVLLETGLPEGDGIQAIGRILEAAPRSKVLILSEHDDLGCLRRALDAGAAGYVTKRISVAELMIAIRAVARGQTYANVPLASSGCPVKTTSSGWTPARAKTRLESLSPRERAVLTLVAMGYTNKEIACRFDLSVKSVETYRYRLSEKLEATGRADLVRFAIEAGLLAGAGTESEQRGRHATGPGDLQPT
jgi:DNA-binding NarL/FixJ family response regulator